MSRTLLAADNRRTALSLVAARACEAADGDLGAVFIRDEDGDDVVISGAGRSSARRLAGLELPRKLAKDILASADLRPMLLDISAVRGASRLPRALQEMGPVMVAPVGVAKQSRGALMILRRASEGSYSRSDLRLLMPFAAEARLAIAFGAARRELERGLLAKDRGRIARELHDGVIQSLYGIGMVLEGIQGEGQSRYKNQLSGITGSINSIIDDLRSYIYDLTPSRLARRGLAWELGLLAEEFQAGSGVVTSVELEDGIDEIDSALARDLVQISREALSNIAQHADASNATIRLDRSRQGIVLVISDDGNGLAARKRTRGRGLGNIVKRAQSWGGVAEIRQSGRHGTAVRVSVPRPTAAQHVSGQASIAFLAAQLFPASALGAVAASLASAS
jgi:two-component system, NarL family, sensor histidine kinase DevS